MTCRGMIGSVDLSLLALGTSYTYVWWSDWRLVPGDITYDVALDVQNALNNFVAIPSVQLASVRPDRPDAATVFAGSATNAQAKYRSAPSMGSYLFARVGVATKVTSGGGGSGDVRFTANWHACGTALGRISALKQPSPANETIWMPFAMDVPVVGIGKVKAGILIEGKEGTGNLENRLAARLRTTDPENPGTWSLLEAGWASASGTGLTARNTGEITVPSGWSDAMTADVALAVRGTTSDVTALVKGVLGGKE